jgi:hypothetical protein
MKQVRPDPEVNMLFYFFLRHHWEAYYNSEESGAFPTLEELAISMWQADKSALELSPSLGLVLVAFLCCIIKRKISK